MDGEVFERINLESQPDVIERNKPEPHTSFAGMREATIREIVDFNKNCDTWISNKIGGPRNCVVVITGGTEPHSAGRCSHENGFKFDLRLNEYVNDYITSNFRPRDPRGPYPKYLNTSTGFEYVKESNHWDVAGCTSSFEVEGEERK